MPLKMTSIKYFLVLVTALFLFNSCATKKEILYFQDAAQYNNTPISYVKPILQPNDILKITVSALLEETAKPYNRITSGSSGGVGSDLIKLDGYLVSDQHTISFPQLGILSTADKTTRQLEVEITQLLVDGGHLKNPTVNVRLLNPKVTVLGEVGSPGTFSFTEESITLLQALGMAGDLTINGRREDILLIRETDGVYKTTTIDVTSADLLTSPYYFIKPNDVLIVNPNGPKIKSSGFISNLGSLISVISIVLSTVILITR